VHNPFDFYTQNTKCINSVAEKIAPMSLWTVVILV